MAAKAQALFQSALHAHQSGQLALAERRYREALALNPGFREARKLLGVALAQQAQFSEAVQEFSTLVAQAPGDAGFRLLMADALYGSGKHQEAAHAFEESFRLAAPGPRERKRYADALLKLRRDQDAEREYREVLRQGGAPGARANLAVTLEAQGRLEEALAEFERASREDPGSAVALVGAARVYQALGRAGDARLWLERALQVAPNDAEAHALWGELCLAAADATGAREAFRRATRSEPDNPQWHTRLGDAALAARDLEAALEAYRRACTLGDQPEPRLQMSSVLAERGDHREALEVLSSTPGDGARLRHALTMPILAESAEQVDAERERCARELMELATRGLAIADPLREVGVPTFLLAYHGRNNRELAGAIASTLRQACPALAFDAAEPTRGARLRVGFLSAFFHEHTVARITHGLIEQLNRDRFEVSVVRAPGPRDAFSAAIDSAADEVLPLPPSLLKAREMLAGRFDVLVYPEIGMDAYTYYLAHARLAPHQCVAWGHAETTGIPTVDAFVSATAFETDGSDAFYSEKLVRLPRMPLYLRPEPASPPATRSSLGLPEGRLFLIPQSLFKMHPEFDPVLRQLLEQEPGAWLALPQGAHRSWTDRLRARFERTLGPAAERVVFFPRIEPERFTQLLQAADAVLDPLYFTGGYTTLLAFSAGVPIVTWDGFKLSGRMSAGLYAQAGVSGPIAGDAEQYIHLARRLVHDRAWKQDLSRRLLESHPRLFHDRQSVLAFEEYLGGVLAA